MNTKKILLIALLALALVAGLAVTGAGYAARARDTSAPAKQPRRQLWLDVSRSTDRQAVRTQYVSRAEEIIAEAIDQGAYVSVVLFAGVASNAVPLVARSMQVRGPNSSYVAAAKRKILDEVMKTVSGALLRPPRTVANIRGSDPAGAALYAIRAAKDGLAPGTSAAVWILTDGEQTFGKTYLVRLLRHHSPREIVARWLRPYIPKARGVDLHFRGLGQATLGSASTRLSIRIEEVWGRFCVLAKAHSCDASAEV